MPDMISKIAHNYGGRDLQPGDPFTADAEYVAVLVTLGRAELVDPQAYATRELVAGSPVAAARANRRIKHKAS